jgi:hypothetical protein
LSPLTTKGDLYTYSTADARLPVGPDGSTVVADSSTTTGLRYQAPIQQNPILNSSLQIWQRGTSIAYSAAGSPYGPDRFNVFSGNTGTCTRQVTNDTTNLPNIQYSARTQRTAGGTVTAAFYFGQSFESVNSIPFVGKTVTFSYYARKGADFSGSTLQAFFAQSTGTDQNYITGAVTGQTNLSNANIASSITTTWQRFTSTFTVTSAATQLGFFFYWLPSGTAGANDWFEVTGMQLEVGSVATPFHTYAGTIQGELAACQRYYYLHASGTALSIGNAGYYSATQVNGMVQFPVSMRTAPSLVATSGTNYYIADRNGADDPFNSLTIYRATLTTAMLYNNSEATGTAGHAALLYTNNASSSIAFSAEL